MIERRTGSDRRRKGHRLLCLGANNKPAPLTESYWVGADRVELNRRIAERRFQQRTPTPAEMAFDPSIAATAALAAHPWKKEAHR